ncbi:MAG: glucose 1-dehydrogenase [Spirochaetaceae bacterium]|nr:MAG: glucose 1-dehydrogenase [Spirochaetaceae bacterium]
MERKLTGKTAIVTGAGRGLGRAHALRLAALGANIVVNDIRLDAAAEFDEELTAATVADECIALGVRAIGVEADVTDRNQVASLVERAVSEFGGIDILVNNAGGMLRPVERSAASTMDIDDLEFIIDVNLMSTVHCCQLVVPSMKERGSGRIVNVSSTAAFMSGVTFTSYGMAKAAIVRFTRSLATELGPFGIHVNCIAPSLIATSRALAQFPDRVKAAATIPLRRLGVPDDVSKVVEFLCTDLSDYVTGQCITVCGGNYLNVS